MMSIEKILFKYFARYATVSARRAKYLNRIYDDFRAHVGARYGVVFCVGTRKSPFSFTRLIARMWLMNKTAHSLEETQRFAEEMVGDILAKRKKRNGALVFALCGDLGSGKTSFAQGIGKAFGVSETVISPTFILERVYTISKKGFKRLVHIDCYRFRESSEIEVLGWGELIKNPENVIVVEWAEKIREYLPKDTIEICFAYHGEGGRTIGVKEKNKVGKTASKNDKN